jgi:hypothetical protein
MERCTNVSVFIFITFPNLQFISNYFRLLLLMLRFLQFGLHFLQLVLDNMAYNDLFKRRFAKLLWSLWYFYFIYYIIIYLIYSKDLQNWICSKCVYNFVNWQSQKHATCRHVWMMARAIRIWQIWQSSRAHVSINTVEIGVKLVCIYEI